MNPKLKSKIVQLCKDREIEESLLYKPCRFNEVVTLRRIISYVLFEHYYWSQNDLVRLFKIDHATIDHYINTTKERIENKQYDRGITLKEFKKINKVFKVN